MKIKKSFSLKAVSLLIASIIVAIAIFAVPNNTGLAIAGSGPIPVPDSVVTAKTTCETNGGSWAETSTAAINTNLLFISLFGSPTTGMFGTCSYPVGSTYAVNACGANYIYNVEYAYNTPSGTTACVFVSPPPPPFSQNKGGDQVSGPLKDNMTIDCINNYNCSVTFPSGSCEGNCIAGPFLPDTSKNLLPASGVHGTAYVQMFNSDGTINTSGTYTVCFDTTGVTNPVLYQFVSGAWVARSSANTNPLCYIGSGGTGAFYLGGS